MAEIEITGGLTLSNNLDACIRDLHLFDIQNIKERITAKNG